MDKTPIYKTNNFYWNSKGNDLLEVISLPLQKGEVISRNFCCKSEKTCQRFRTKLRDVGGLQND